MTGMERQEGGYHCGAVRFRIASDLTRVTECNCFDGRNWEQAMESRHHGR